MINFRYAKSYCKDDISLIENFEKAIADDNIWDCHHRKEITTSKKQLIENNEYYNRPASELIFLTHSEHKTLHMKGKQYWLGRHHSEEAKRKISEAHKDNKYWLGKHHSEETKKKMSESNKGKNKGKTPWNKGKIMSEETKKKMTESHKCKHHTEETKRKMADARKDRIWFNNGIKNIFVKECPEGFEKGRLKKSVNHKNGQVVS